MRQPQIIDRSRDQEFMRQALELAAQGAAMGEVVTNASQINQFLNEISVACREQAIGVEEVGRAIQELDKGTQQNSALVEETASAASALNSQADILQEEIANCRVA